MIYRDEFEDEDEKEYDVPYPANDNAILPPNLHQRQDTINIEESMFPRLFLDARNNPDINIFIIVIIVIEAGSGSR